MVTLFKLLHDQNAPLFIDVMFCGIVNSDKELQLSNIPDGISVSESGRTTF